MADNIKNPFKDLGKLIKDAPPNLKKKVMNDVASAKLIMDLASLFTLNYKEVLSGMFKTRRKK
ncbi:MAG: hypothetical protein HKM92_05385 [Arenibacter sp.]|nr:hypothetical protein [Muriicola sp.]NNE02001.1 hypothetical protein [Eudoraea sp.]NNG09580.1 hypothetical protein [Arenibacter sp.]